MKILILIETFVGFAMTGDMSHLFGIINHLILIAIKMIMFMLAYLF